MSPELKAEIKKIEAELGYELQDGETLSKFLEFESNVLNIQSQFLENDFVSLDSIDRSGFVVGKKQPQITEAYSRLSPDEQNGVLKGIQKNFPVATNPLAVDLYNQQKSLALDNLSNSDGNPFF